MSDRLEPGARPPNSQLEPVQGADGKWRLDRIRHRRLNGTYTRTSATGFSPKECLDEWDLAFERKIRQGTIRRRTERHRFKLTDPMSLAFEKYFELEQKRVSKGKIVQKTYDMYEYVTYRGTGPRARTDTIRLDSEMGSLSIGEAGVPVFLDEYLEDVTDIVPGIAALQYVVLRGTFRMLTVTGGLFTVSPMAEIMQPEQRESFQRALEPAERAELYCRILARPRISRWFRIMFLLLLGTGIRPGEAYALWWSDCPDLDDDTIERAVLRVGATVVRPVDGGPVFRQTKRKHGKVGVAYFVTLPRWLTAELRAYKRACKPAVQDSPILLSMVGTMVSPESSNSTLARVKDGSELEWFTWGNLRDTVATHVAGRSGDPRRASAQLGHQEGARMATENYIDPRGYVHAVVDNADFLEELNPLHLGGTLEDLGKFSDVAGAPTPLPVNSPGISGLSS